MSCGVRYEFSTVPAQKAKLLPVEGEPAHEDAPQTASQAVCRRDSRQSPDGANPMPPGARGRERG